MTAEFDRDIAVIPTGDEQGDRSFLADLRAGWTVGGGLNGGYLLATLANAVRRAARHRDPLAISAHYLATSVPGRATVTTRAVREGRSLSTFAADLVQDGTTRITALATLGELDALPDDVETTATEPVLPPREECWAIDRVPAGSAPPLQSRYTMLFDPASAGWMVGRPGGTPVVEAWFRLNDDREPDPLALLLAVDALPPTTFELGRTGWAPTLELTAHVRARPVPGWLKVRQETRNLAGGMFEEDCEVWDASGRLVAQSRQLARQPRPPA